MADKTGDSGGRRNRWPLDLDTKDPEAIADFCLGLGYSQESVVTMLVRRCNLDVFTAKSIVADVARNH